MKIIFITILILFAPYPASAKMAFCDFEKNPRMLDSMYDGLYYVLTEEELNYVSETHIKLANGEIQDCSILDPYLRKVNVLAYDEEELQELGISHLFPFTNEFFAQFPNLEEVRIETNQSEIPENLFHGLPHLKVVEIEADNMSTLPTNLFKQNNQLIKFVFLGHALIRDIEPEFFRNFPLIEDLSMVPRNLGEGMATWHPPDDICTYNKHLKDLSLGSVYTTRAPSSCCTPEWLERFEKNGEMSMRRQCKL